jgi:hypothetical protein
VADGAGERGDRAAEKERVRGRRERKRKLGREGRMDGWRDGGMKRREGESERKRSSERASEEGGRGEA